MQHSCGAPQPSCRGRMALSRRSSTPPRCRSLTPPRLRASNDREPEACDGKNVWIKRTAGAALLGIATIGVATNPAVAAHAPLLEIPTHTVLDVPAYGDTVSKAVQRQSKTRVISEDVEDIQSSEWTADMLEMDQQVLQQLQQAQQRHRAEQQQRGQKVQQQRPQQQQQQQHRLQQKASQAAASVAVEDLSEEEASAQLEVLRSELDRVRAAESSALTALQSQEEALLKLASQLKEAAHSEISTLQATEGRLLSVIQNSAQRLRSMQHQHQEQQASLNHILLNAERIVQAVLSGGFMMTASGAVISAAAVYAITCNSFSARGSGSSSSSGVGRGSNPAASGGPPAAAGRPAVAAAATATGELYWVGERRQQKEQQKQCQQQNGRWSSVGVLSESLPSVSELPGHIAQLLTQQRQPSSGSTDGRSSPAVMQQLQQKAAEASAAAQALYSLQQQDADAAVKAAELAASSIEAERRVAEAMRSEALAAQQLLQVERAAKEAAEADAQQLSAELTQLKQQLALQHKGWGPRRSSGSDSGSKGGGVSMAFLQKPLAEAHERLTAATELRSAAEAELRKISNALLHEQHQSATIAQQLEITHASLQDVTEQLHALQQQIQQERAQHNQQLARTTAEADHGMQQLQQRHEQQVQQLQEEQKHQLTRKNSVEHRLDTELAEAKAQLAAVMHDLAAERHTSGRLHEQVAKLHHEFEDARAHLDVERARACALSKERSRLEAALEVAGSEAAAAESAATAARMEAAAAAERARQAAQETKMVSEKLLVVQEKKQEVEERLEAVSEVVEQQQEKLVQKEQQVGELQAEVVTTRDALHVERERVVHLESKTVELHRRISNMATIREQGNLHLSGQINKLREQLDDSRKQQQESLQQLHALTGSFTAAQQELALERATNKDLKSTARELQQRLSNQTATGAHYAASSAAVSGQAKQGELHAQGVAEEARAKLVQANNQLQQLRQRLAAEQASNSSLQHTADEYKQRLTNMQATKAAPAQDTHAAAAEQLRQASVVSELASANQQLQELNEQHGQELQEVKQQLVIAQEEAAAVLKSAEAAVQSQQEELESIKSHLAASESQAAAAKAAEAAARAQVLFLQQQLEQHSAEAKRQEEALVEVKAQLTMLKTKAAENRQQLQIERERALDHESTIEELKERITSLQQLQAHQQVAHGQQIDALLAQIRDAQAQVAEASQQKKKAETKCLTARDEVERRQKELTAAHKQQAELEHRLEHIMKSRAGSAASPAVHRLQQQLVANGQELDLADEELQEMTNKYEAARGELERSEMEAQDLVSMVQQLQQELESAAEGARKQAEVSAEEQQQLQQQLKEQQQQLEDDRAAIEGLQQEALTAKQELSQQQELAAYLQQQAQQLQGRLAATEAAKIAAEQEAVELAEQLLEAEEEMGILQNAQAETEHVAAQVAADLASAREWAHSSAQRFAEVQEQLGTYRMDLLETQEELLVTNARLEAAEAQHAAAGEELIATKEQLAAEQLAHGSTHQQLAEVRVQLEALKLQYLGTRDQLEAERDRSMQLERTVCDLKERLSSLQRLREQQNETAAAERAKWHEQVLAGQQEHEEARQALESMQQEYFTAYERLDEEQSRVATLENIIGQLEEKMQELSQLTLTAGPSMSALEVGGGPAAELVVVGNALKQQWKEAVAQLKTSQHMLATLEEEYKQSRMIVDEEHERYCQVEASLEFLTERLASIDRAGAGEDAEYERSSAELHQQIEEKASCLVACQLRIAALKEELAASKQRLDEEEQNEAELAQRAEQLEAEAEAAGQRLEEMPDQLRHVDAGNATAAQRRAPTRAAGADAAEQRVHQQLEQEESPVQRSDLAPQDKELAELEAEQLLGQLNVALQQSTGMPMAAKSDASGHDQAAVAGMVVDMAVVRRHVEEMAKQYVKRLSEAEEEIRAVKTVWQQAEAELTALRQQQQHSGRRSPLSGRGSPAASSGGRPDSSSTSESAATTVKHSVDLSALKSEINPAIKLEHQGLGVPSYDEILEIQTLAPVFAPRQVSGSTHAAADAEHTMPQKALLLELQAPVFGRRSSISGGTLRSQIEGTEGTMPPLDQSYETSGVGLHAQGFSNDERLGFNGLPIGRGSPSVSGTGGAGSRMPVVAAASLDSISEDLPTGWGDREEQDGYEAAPAAAEAETAAVADLSLEEVEELQAAAERIVSSSSTNCRVRVRRSMNSSNQGV